MAVKKRPTGGSAAVDDKDETGTSGEGRASSPTSSRTGKDDIWTADLELDLLHTMIDHKPAGVAKNFKMALIHHKMAFRNGGEFRGIRPGTIWDRISKFYDIDLASDIENQVDPLAPSSGPSGPLIPKADPEDEPVAEFSLPFKDFSSVLQEMKRTSGIHIDLKDVIKGEETPTPKTSSKRPTRSTPGSTPAKRRK